MRAAYDHSDIIQVICQTIGLEPLCGSVTSPWWCSRDRLLFTMPMSRMMPMIAMMLSAVFKQSNARSAPTPANGRVERMVTG